MAGAEENPEVLDIRPYGDHPAWSEDDLAAGKRLTYTGAKQLLASVVILPAPGDYDAFLLSLAQTYFYGVLEKVWHLGFVGTRSAGKSTGLRVWAYLANETYLTGPATSAALIDLMGKAHGVGLDEVDDTMERRGDDGKLVEAVLRLGTDRGNVYLHRVPSAKGRGWRTIGIDPFCPAAFTYSGRLDDALTSRCDTIRMPRLADPRLARRRAKRFRTHLAPLKVWLEYELGRAQIRWGPVTIRRLEESAGFLAEADRLRVDLPRTGEIGELMLLLAKMLDWPVGVETIQGRLEEIDGSSVDEQSEEVRAAVLRLTDETSWSVEGGHWNLPTTTIRDAVNEARGAKERPITANVVIRSLRELGIDEFNRVSRTDKRRTAVIREADRDRWLGTDSPSPVVSVGTLGAGVAPLDEVGNVPGARSGGGDSGGDAVGTMTRSEFYAPSPAPPAPTPFGTDGATAAATAPSPRGLKEPELERAVRLLGPTITYPDGRVTDRRSGTVIAYPRDWPRIGQGRPAAGGWGG